MPQTSLIKAYNTNLQYTIPRNCMCFTIILGTALPVSNSCQGSPNMTTTPFCFFIDILIFAFPAR